MNRSLNRNQAKVERKRGVARCGYIFGTDFPVVLTGNLREMQLQAADPNFDLFGAIRDAFDARDSIDQIDNS